MYILERHVVVRASGIRSVLFRYAMLTPGLAAREVQVAIRAEGVTGSDGVVPKDVLTLTKLAAVSTYSCQTIVRKRWRVLAGTFASMRRIVSSGASMLLQIA